MWCTQLRWSLLFVILLSLTACVSNPSSQRPIEVQPVVSPLSMADGVVLVPARYVTCSVVEGRWFYSTWVPEHRVCYYRGSHDKVVWVAGAYYTCTHHAIKAGKCPVWYYR